MNLSSSSHELKQTITFSFNTTIQHNGRIDHSDASLVHSTSTNSTFYFLKLFYSSSKSFKSTKCWPYPVVKSETTHQSRNFGELMCCTITLSQNMLAIHLLHQKADISEQVNQVKRWCSSCHLIKLITSMLQVSSIYIYTHIYTYLYIFIYHIFWMVSTILYAAYISTYQWNTGPIHWSKLNSKTLVQSTSNLKSLLISEEFQVTSDAIAIEHLPQKSQIM